MYVPERWGGKGEDRGGKGCGSFELNDVESKLFGVINLCCYVKGSMYV